MLRANGVLWSARLFLVGFLVAFGAIAAPSGEAIGAGTRSFVTRNGTQLLLDGVPYRFTGLNIYHANSDGWCSYPWGSGNALDNALTEIGPGKRVFRAWFFQTLATTGGQRDWSAFDNTLSVAAAHNMRVVVTLTDQWGECGAQPPETSYYKTASWYTAGYMQVDPAMLLSYRDWIAEVVTRYKDDPTILAWQLINEAEVKDIQGPACSANAAQILKTWAADVSGLVKDIDSNHLVSLGTIGTGQCGASGPDYKSLHDIPDVDLCEFHDYSPNAAMPGDQWNGLQVRINQCNELNKPIFVGEMGINPASVDGTLQARADAFQAKLDAQFAAGVKGILAWAWLSTDLFIIGPGDPLLDVLNYFPYSFTGFFQPVDNPPTVNSARAGSAIPVKFSLAGNQGVEVFAPGSPASQRQACATGDPLDTIEETATAGSSGLSYDPATDTYTYVWKTSKPWAGTCRQLMVRFFDGSEYVANFKFK